MYKKKLAMDQANGDAPEPTDHKEAHGSNDDSHQESSKENGDKSQKKKTTKKRKNGILKVTRKKIKKSDKTAPGPDEDGEYEVEAIVDHKTEKGKTVYRVRWKGYSSAQDTWETAANLTCKDLLKKYKKQIKKEKADVYAFLGKNRVPRSVLARLEKLNNEESSAPKTKRKPPSERGTHNSGGLRGRTKGELKVLNLSI
ncbi:CLUMA_CG018037, isoform A [Clunio marinus]|uniref:CLUMA_CG018037, isoform A n=1 Tax=Clunio marinus TaxID=568069 RepID=A0A1J1J3F5_9DIPT|nr:CLUMA_CG018037, isoform A [Clunio marinus]